MEFSVIHSDSGHSVSFVRSDAIQCHALGQW